MRYLVDGNNVMGQRVGFHRDRAGARRRLVDELQRFARRGGDTVEVVFDGTPSPGRLPGPPSEGQGRDAPAGLREGGVRVTYAGRGADADTRIRELVGRAEGGATGRWWSPRTGAWRRTCAGWGRR